MREAGVEPRRTPGNFIADIGKPKPYVVFTPFWRAWRELPRREIHGAPRKVPVPSVCASTRSRPSRGEVPDPLRGGETEGRKRMLAWRDEHYERRSRPAGSRDVDALALLALRLRQRA